MTRLVRTSGSQSASHLLSRILERPELVAVVDKLSPPVLGQLIAHVGLEDAGELVAAVSAPQLARLWDRDLWRRPEQGGAERFDPERFAVWLAVMLEAGEAQTVARLRALPFDLLTLAVHRLLRVVERGAWLRGIEEGEEEGPEGGLHAPWQELVLLARDERAWDTLLTALLALDEEDHALVRRVLERCGELDAQLADLALEEDQLYTALTRTEALESDVAAERDERQSASGYVSAADAQSFLRLARSEPHARASQLDRDPITGAYFRELASTPDPQGQGDDDSGSDLRAAVPGALDADESAALGSLLDLLADSGVLPGGAAREALPSTASASQLRADGTLPMHYAEPLQAPSGTGERLEPEATGALVTSAEPAPANESGGGLLRAALRVLERDQPALWSQRMEELGFLANVVLAGSRDGARPFDPRAALEASSALCSLALELELGRKRSDSLDAAAQALASVPADRWFRVGCARVYWALTVPARRALQLRCERYGTPQHCVELVEALQDDELGAWPEAIDAELLRWAPARFAALRALAESIPSLAGELREVGDSASRPAPAVRFVTTRGELKAAMRLLRAVQPRSTSARPRV